MPQADQNREAFQARFPKPDEVTWNGKGYDVLAGWENSYRLERFCAHWVAWQAATAHTASLVAQAVAQERARCVKLCEAQADGARKAEAWMAAFAADQCAAAIREQETP